ncbi:MAG: DUF5047 domain-containing protein [Mycobacterium sp.]|uniref:DUF5047 domain-containing protein n=1 Tax=Mycobacterium sp. TaxID=1785 RepID=UPI003F975FF6
MYAGSLNDFFFCCNSSGAGQLIRNEDRGGDSPGFASSFSWTSWATPTGYSALSANAWHHFEIDISGLTATLHIDGTSYGTLTVASWSGTYIGLQADGIASGGAYWCNLSYATAGTGTGSVSVLGTAAGVALAAPTVSSVFPATGVLAGGTSVVITGTNFTGVTAVEFGSTNATSYTVNSSTQITAVSPSGSAGTVNITVTTAGGTSGTGIGNQFIYSNTVTPTIPVSVGSLIFDDEFATESALDTTKWSAQWGASMNNVSIIAGNTAVVNGVGLELTLASSTSGAAINSNPYATQGSYGSTPGFQFTYGYVEFEATFNADWSSGWTTGQNWPITGEFDIAEVYALQLDVGNYHYGSGPTNINGGYPTWGNPPSGPHIYAMYWQPGRIDFYADGVLYNTVTGSAVVSSPQFLIFTHGYWAGGVATPNTVSVAYVRVWALPGQGAGSGTVTVSGTAAGVVKVPGAGTGSVAVTGTAAGAHFGLNAGAAAGHVSVAGTAIGYWSIILPPDYHPPPNVWADAILADGLQIVTVGEVYAGINGPLLATINNITNGTVKIDQTNANRRTCSDIFMAIDASTTYLVPGVNSGDLFPDGGELFLQKGLVYPDGTTQLQPLGRFLIETPKVTRAVNGAGSLVIDLSGTDRSGTVARSLFTQPYATDGESTVDVAIMAILNMQVPQLTAFAFAASPLVPPVASYAVGDNAWTACQALAALDSKELFFDPSVNAVCILRDIPDATVAPIAAVYNADLSSIITQNTRGLSNIDVPNVILAQSQGSGVAIPLQAMWFDNNPLSPTYYGPAGPPVPPAGSYPTTVSVITVSGITDLPTLQAMANTAGAAQQGRFETCDTYIRDDPARDASDVVTINDPVLNMEANFVLDSLVIQMGYSTAMEIVGRRVY